LVYETDKWMKQEIAQTHAEADPVHSNGSEDIKNYAETSKTELNIF